MSNFGNSRHINLILNQYSFFIVITRLIFIINLYYLKKTTFNTYNELDIFNRKEKDTDTGSLLFFSISSFVVYVNARVISGQVYHLNMYICICFIYIYIFWTEFMRVHTISRGIKKERKKK